MEGGIRVIGGWTPLVKRGRTAGALVAVTV